jgi:hypothetical protein
MNKEQVAELIGKIPKGLDQEDFLVALATLAAKEEREACEQICEDLFMSDGVWCARAIRARG